MNINYNGKLIPIAEAVERLPAPVTQSIIELYYKARAVCTAAMKEKGEGELPLDPLAFSMFKAIMDDDTEFSTEDGKRLVIVCKQ